MPTPCGKFMPHLPSTRYDARLGFEAFTIIPNNSHYEADRTSCTVSDFIRTMQDILAREPSNTASFYVAADSAKTLKLVHDSRMGSHVTSLWWIWMGRSGTLYRTARMLPLPRAAKQRRAQGAITSTWFVVVLVRTECPAWCSGSRRPLITGCISLQRLEVGFLCEPNDRQIDRRME